MTAAGGEGGARSCGMNWEKTFVSVLVILGSTLCMFMAYFFGEHFTEPPLPKSRLETLWSYLSGGGKAAGCMFILVCISIVADILLNYSLAILISSFLMGMFGVSVKRRKLLGVDTRT